MEGIVVCPQPRACEIGVQILEDGGNAFDAAVAVSFAQMIVDPFMCGLGGMATAHLWSRDLDRHWIVDGSLRAGSLVSPGMWMKDCLGRSPFSGSSLFEDFRSEIGYPSICVPGDAIHRDFCTRPLSELLEPSIRIAAEGFRATPHMRDYLLWPPFAGTPSGVTRLQASETCSRLYLHTDGSIFAEGELIQNPDYANVLEHLARKGLDDFYRGELSHIIGRDLEKNASWITEADMRAYQVGIHPPASAEYRDFRVYSSSSPSGGPLFLHALNALQGFNLSGMSHNAPEHLRLLADILSAVFRNRAQYLTDPKNASLEYDKSLSPRRAFRSTKESCNLRERHSEIDLSGHTTHLIVVDDHKNIASITHSLGWSSGVITPGLGFIYNNGMNLFNPTPGYPDSLAPGKLRPSALMPSIIFQDSNPVLVAGALGGNAILSGTLQVTSNVLDFGFSAVEAVTAPRIHAEGPTIWCESRLRSVYCSELKRKGYTIERQVQSLVPWFGQVQTVRILPNSKLQGGSDPRGGGGSVMLTN
jgi:gamma-glutamyltranspeptidase/glutathione hydrolase